ncbi:phosphatidate phosphatase LPIN1 [Corchorus capsularis]|uniref:Phosphatidate phosphatase LPIN1 n=1 Tax=Corchorus capsularis TaxID=210143 RepID=A0A1R3GIG4_COCAP|nr:phosphatidate phosphatase LPIN1 [Corchorus capsularis]
MEEDKRSRKSRHGKRRIAWRWGEIFYNVKSQWRQSALREPKVTQRESIHREQGSESRLAMDDDEGS